MNNYELFEVVSENAKYNIGDKVKITRDLINDSIKHHKTVESKKGKIIDLNFCKIGYKIYMVLYSVKVKDRIFKLDNSCLEKINE